MTTPVRHRAGRGPVLDWVPSAVHRAIIPTSAVVAVLVVARLNRVMQGIVWAEDGSVYLQDQYTKGGVGLFFHPYNGYAQVLPRVLTAVVAMFPISWHGALMVAIAAAFQVGCAAIAFAVVGAHRRGWVLPALVAVFVGVLPVGGEVFGSLANIQWFLLFAGCVAPLWLPRSPGWRVVNMGVVLGLALTCPFGPIVTVVAVAAWRDARTRYHLVLLGAGVLGTIGQAVSMITAPSRSVEHQLAPVHLVRGYLERVLGDGVFGAGGHQTGVPADNILSGVVVAAALLALVVYVGRTAGAREIALPVLLLGLSVFLYVVPVVMSGVATELPWLASRYYVAPVLLLIAAIATLAPGTDHLHSTFHVQHKLPAGFLVVAVFSAVVTSWNLPYEGKSDGPVWSDEIATGRSECDSNAALRSVKIPISPPGWFTVVPCSDLLRN